MSPSVSTVLLEVLIPVLRAALPADKAEPFDRQAQRDANY
jgi:hypothetical protein